MRILILIICISISIKSFTQNNGMPKEIKLSNYTASKVNINSIILTNEHFFADDYYAPYEIHYDLKNKLDSIGFNSIIIQIDEDDKVFSNNISKQIQSITVINPAKEIDVGIVTNKKIFIEKRGLLNVDWELGINYLFQVRLYKDNSKIQLCDKIIISERRKGQTLWQEYSKLNHNFNETGITEIDNNRNMLISNILSYLNSINNE